MARLSLKMQSSQLHQLRFSCSELTESQKMQSQSPIQLLVILRRKSRSNERFVSILEQQFEGSEEFEDLCKIMQEFRNENPDPNEIEPLSGPILPNGAFVFHPGKDQSHVFKRMLLNVSNSINWIHLEIMVAISPIPDSLKEHMNKGYQLFEELKRHGCISENDTELLDEIFTLFNVQSPLQLLRSYQEQYPQTIFPEPPPSAPAFATPPLSLQPRSSYSSPSESSSSFHSLPSFHTPTETGGSPYMSRRLPSQPHSLPRRVPTYPRPPQTTSPQHRVSSTYPRPPAAFSSVHSSQQTQPFRSQIPYPTTRSLEERRKRHQGERGGEQSTEPPEEQPPAVKRTREMTSFPSLSASSYPPTSQAPDSLPEGGASSLSSVGSSLSSVGSSLASYNCGHEFPSPITEKGGLLTPQQSEQEERSPKRTLAQQQETVRMYQVSEGISPSQPPYSSNTNTPSAPSFTPQNSSKALESHRNTYSHPHSTGEELYPHSSDEEPHPDPHACPQVSHLTDKELLVYRVPRVEGQPLEESGGRGADRMVGPYGSLRHPGEYAPPPNVFMRPLVHGVPPPMSINLTAQQQPPTRPPDGYSKPLASQQFHRAEPASCSENENSELAICHESSSGQPVRQASSQANVAIGKYDEFEPPSYISQPSFPGTRGQFVGIQPRSYDLPSGSTWGSSSLATSDLLSSESSGSSHQGSTQPSTAHLLSSIEERQSAEEEDQEEEEEREPQLKELKPAKQQKSSTFPAEEKQPKSWSSRIFSRVWTTITGSAEKEKENEDSDDSYVSCGDDETP